jgi:hypothetical protein
MRRATVAVLLLLAVPGVALAQPPAEPPSTDPAPPASDPPAAPDVPDAGAPLRNDPANVLADPPSGGADASVPEPPASVEPGSDPASEEPTLPEEHRPTLGVTVEADGVRTGDLVRLVITADVPEGDDVGFPEQRLGTFEIHARRFRSEPLEGGARRRFVFELDLLALEPGDQELPAIRLRVVTESGQVGIVRTEPRTIAIGSHIANEPDAQPRPPTPPRPVLEEDYTLLWVLGVLLALIVTAVVSWLVARWWTRRPKAAKPAPPPRPPWEVALEQLELIRREKAALIATDRQVELVDRVSDVLRQYLGQRYDFNGLESTTDEVVSRLSKVKLKGVSLGDVTALLADSDLVKFAKAVPDEAQCDRMLAGALQIVRATTPRPDATPSARPEVSGAPARVITRDGEVVLPVTAHGIEEAERAIRGAVGAAFREVAQDPSFEGTLRVAIAPTLRPDANATDALRRLHARLSSELATVALPGGRQARLVFEHWHAHRARPGEAERPVTRTIIDEKGVRVEDVPAGAEPAARRAAAVSAEPEPRRAEVDASSSTATSAPADVTAPTPLVTPRDEKRDTPFAAPPAEWRSPPAPSPAERIKTGPVEWDAPTLPDPPAQAPEPPQAGPAPNDASAPPGADLRPTIDARALDRVLPVFHLGAESPPSGALVRWVTGLERPVLYDAGHGDPLGADVLTGLGLTRGGLHEKALANLRRSVPPGFAPGDEPALLDDPSLSTILALPELVPIGHAWIAYPVRGEGLFVMREESPSTRGELVRLAQARGSEPVFERPVRVSRRGFEALEWPSAERTTDPGYATPDGRGEP